MAILTHDCVRCGARNMTFDVRGANNVGRLGADWQFALECFSICRACGLSTVFKLQIFDYNNRDRFRQAVNIWLDQSVTLNNYFRIEGYVSSSDKATASPPEGIPNDLAAIFKEAARCHSIGCSNAAGTMFRLCLDRATQGFLPDPNEATEQPNGRQRRDLGLRLPWLFAHNRLPAALEPLSHCVREDGNDGAHAGNLSSEDAEDLIDFTTALLDRLYAEPERLRLAQERRDARRAPRPSA